MCTATYLPIGPKGFILTHSRDEKAIRPAALPPREARMGGHVVTYPKDPQGMGTWIASSNDLTVCLLNGAFVPHRSQPPYKHSRGLVALAAFGYTSVDAFIRQYPFGGLESFTLLALEGGRLTELRWNGRRLFVADKDPKKTHIWSSVTLYTTEVIRQRERWFTRWQQQISHWTVDTIRQFHKTAGEGDPQNALQMNRQDQYFTVSLTSVLHNGELSAMRYEDLISPKATHSFLPQSHAAAPINLA